MGFFYTVTLFDYVSLRWLRDVCLPSNNTSIELRIHYILFYRAALQTRCDTVAFASSGSHPRPLFQSPGAQLPILAGHTHHMSKPDLDFCFPSFSRQQSPS